LRRVQTNSRAFDTRHCCLDILAALGFAAKAGYIDSRHGLAIVASFAALSVRPFAEADRRRVASPYVASLKP
jgi:hypothetical protein